MTSQETACLDFGKYTTNLGMARLNFTVLLPAACIMASRLTYYRELALQLSQFSNNVPSLKEPLLSLICAFRVLQIACNVMTTSLYVSRAKMATI